MVTYSALCFESSRTTFLGSSVTSDGCFSTELIALPFSGHCPGKNVFTSSSFFLSLFGSDGYKGSLHGRLTRFWDVNHMKHTFLGI